MAAARLRDLGATVVKVEPPKGDPLAFACSALYDILVAGMEIVQLDLKDDAGRRALDARIENADLLLSASLPRSLEALGLGWESLQERFPRLCGVNIVGFPSNRLPGFAIRCRSARGCR